MKTNSIEAIKAYVSFELKLNCNKFKSSSSFNRCVFDVFVKHSYNLLFKDLVHFCNMKDRKSFKKGALPSENYIYRNHGISFSVSDNFLFLALSLNEGYVEIFLSSPTLSSAELFRFIRNGSYHLNEDINIITHSVKFFTKNE